MKKFLLKICLFFGLCAAAFVGTYAAYFVRLRTMSFALPPDKKIVFIGDSHIEIGVNETLIPNAYNFAKSGDPYLDQLTRLKRLLEDNPQVETIFITATPHSLARYGDQRIFSDFVMQSVVPTAFPLYSRRERDLYLKKDPLRLAKFVFGKPMSSAKRTIDACLSRQRAMAKLGARHDSASRNLEKSIAVERGLRPGKKLHGDDSCGTELQVAYLREIVELTRSRGARIIFLNPPLYRAEEFFDVAYFENLLKEKFSDIEFWDYADFPMPDDCRQDINHLNRWGAEIFSRELAERMKREGIVSEEAPDGVPAAGTPRAGQEAAIARRSGKETRFS